MVGGATDKLNKTTYIVTTHTFLDEMAKFVNRVVVTTPMLLEKYEEEASEDYQAMDSRKLFDVIRVYTSNNKDMGVLHCLSTILLSMANRIAHQCYLIDTSDEDDPVFSPSLVGTKGFVRTMIYYGDKMAAVMKDIFELSDEVRSVTAAVIVLIHR